MSGRLRLPLDTLQRIRPAVASRADQRLPDLQQLWHGLRPKVIDGSTLSLPDTPKNQRAYPQSRSPKPGCGFPLLKMVAIYARRWKIELWLRDIKTSMGVETLRCQSPKMVHKELEMFFIAYNLMRALMTEAGAIHDVALERISFKGTVDAARQYSIAMAQARSKKKQPELVAQLLTVLARDAVPERPGRCEPRAVKRRPKPFPLLNQPRRRFKEIPHRNRYWTNNPRKSKR